MPQFIAGSGTFTTDGDTTTIDWPGGVGVIQVDGSFGGGTVSLFASLVGTTFTNGGSTVQATSSSAFNFEIEVPCKIKLNLTGATSPNINWWIGVPNNG